MNDEKISCSSQSVAKIRCYLVCPLFIDLFEAIELHVKIVIEKNRIARVQQQTTLLNWYRSFHAAIAEPFSPFTQGN